MKHVYFVRHGETNSNKTNIVQGLDDELSDTGRRQAAQVAARAQNLEFDYFVSSDAVRAVETATAIKEATKIEFTTNEVFREIARPASFIGQSRNTEEYQKFLHEELANVGDPSWQVEEGEHFQAGKERALKALTFLEECDSEAILVVTHGHFLRYMVAAILCNKDLKPDFWLTISRALWMNNTGITLCNYDGERWRVITWNDHAHFAE